MIVKAYYAEGRIDVFDTDHMTDCVPQSGNLLTNYTLDISDINSESLWLCSYYYEATQAYKNNLGPKGLPVARRRDGWSFLIADADDLIKLNRLTVDGETVLVQMAGELVDAAALSWAYSVAAEYGPMSLATYKYFLQTWAKEGVACEESVLSSIGVPRQVLNWLSGAISSEREQEPRF